GLLVAGSFYACSESYLETVPTDQYNEANWWETQDHALSSINGCYNVLRSSNIGGSNRLREESFSPNAYNMSDVPSIADGTMTPGSDSRFQSYWNSYYEGVGRTNYFLDNVDKVQMDESLKQRLKGEAYFL